MGKDPPGNANTDMTRTACCVGGGLIEAGLRREVGDPLSPVAAWLPPPSAFAGFRFPPGVIAAAVRWYLRNSGSPKTASSSARFISSMTRTKVSSGERRARSE
jgi:hypothetical protein